MNSMRLSMAVRSLVPVMAVVAWSGVMQPGLLRAQVYKADNDDNIDLTSSWWTTATGTTNPASFTTSDVLWFGNGMGASRTVALGGPLSVGGLRLDNNSGSPNYSATISAGNTLTLNGPTGLLQNSGTGGSLTVDCNVVAATAQSWITSRALNVGGSVDLGGNQITVNTAGTNGVFTISGQIMGTRVDGSNALLLSPTSTSGGRLILTNASNSFTGNIEFTSGLASGLEFTSAGALGANTTTQQIRFRNTGGTPGSGSFLRYTGTADEFVSKTIQCDTSIGMRLESDSVGGSVTFNGAFSQSNRGLYLGGTGTGDNTLAIAFTGSGGLTKRGAGTWLLTAANTNTGGVTVEAGTLQVGAGSTTGGLGSGNVVNNATLQFNRSDSVTVANTISGSGSLAQVSTGTLNVTGSNTFSGNTTVSSGTLALASGGGIYRGGFFGTAVVTVSSGAALELQNWAYNETTGSLGGCGIMPMPSSSMAAPSA